MRRGLARFLPLALLALTVVATGCGGTSGASASGAPSAASADPETLYQVSTLNAVLDGLYQPATTIGALKRLGDTGIGTFTALDGEMIMVDGTLYQLLSDGSVVQPSDQLGSPLAAITTFDADKSVVISAAKDYAALQTQIDTAITNVNQPSMVRIEGHFDYVKTRVAPRQSEPYPPLVEVAATQPEFEFHNVDGVIVGTWFPAWMEQLNAPGYHLHFLTADRSAGGHLLEISTAEATATVDGTPTFSVTFPQTEEFQTVDLSGDYAEKIEKAE